MSTVQSTPLLSPQLLAQLERLELVTRKIFRGRLKGERKSRRKGQSVEFADFRNYVPGEDIRRVAQEPGTGFTWPRQPLANARVPGQDPAE